MLVRIGSIEVELELGHVFIKVGGVELFAHRSQIEANSRSYVSLPIHIRKIIKIVVIEQTARITSKEK
jgi:hypothetical protein